MNSQLSDAEKQALPCFDNPGPWQDASNIIELKWAARQCVQRCTQRAWCERERLSVIAEIDPKLGGGTGVWAGQIWSHGDRCTSGQITRQGDTHR